LKEVSPEVPKPLLLEDDAELDAELDEEFGSESEDAILSSALKAVCKAPLL
jgi:hypothetical protein